MMNRLHKNNYMVTLLWHRRNVVIVAPISTTQRKLPLYHNLPDNLATKGTVLLDQLVTLDYKVRSFKFKEKVPAVFLDELLNIARRIFTV